MLELLIQEAIQRQFLTGDLVLIIQIQGADIDASNTDSYGDNMRGHRLPAILERILMPAIMNTIRSGNIRIRNYI